MKIALCLSGQPRFVESGVENIKKFLLEPNGITDVFIHAWKCGVFQSAQPHQSGKWSYHPNTEQILSSLNPKSLLVQEDHHFNELSHLQDLPTARQKNLASMFYSVRKSNELRREYERLNGAFDLAIKTRIDIQYEKPVILSQLNIADGHIQVPEMYQHTRISDSYPSKSGMNYSSLSDTFMIGAPKDIDIIDNVINNFANTHAEIWPYAYGEAYLGYHIRGLNKIPIQMVDIRYSLMR